MEEEEGGLRLSKRFSDQGGEVDLKTKAGTAWSHNFLNQKPWHPLSYPNQRRKWIAEQTHAQRQRRSEEVAREFAQEQEFFRQSALVSKKEKEKMEIMKAVSFMYVRPPGYNPESAKAAEIAEETRKQEESNSQLGPEGTSDAAPLEGLDKDQLNDGKKKKRPRDVFGRALPTEEQFEVLKNAPKMETGIAGRAKPFGIELRNVKCLRCGTFGHQSGDRECPLKDTITPNEESRLKRDDPLTTMMAHAESSEPLKWELKQRPGMSPPRGGFNPDDPNQQIVAEDIFDEYGGFLGAEIIPDLLANFSSEKPKKKKKKKSKRQASPSDYKSKDYHDSSSEDDERKNSKKRKHKMKKVKHSTSSESDDAEFGRHHDSDDEKKSKRRKHKRKKQKHSDSSCSDDSEIEEHRRGSKHKMSYDEPGHDARRKQSNRNRNRTGAHDDDDDDSLLNREGRKSKSSGYDDSGSREGIYYNSRSDEHYRPSDAKSRRTSEYDDSRYEGRHRDDLRSSEGRPKQSRSKTCAYDDSGPQVRDRYDPRSDKQSKHKTSAYDDSIYEDRGHDDSRSKEHPKQGKSRTSGEQHKHKSSAYDDRRRSDHHHRSRHGHNRD